MRILGLIALLFTFTCHAPLALAADGSVIISSPKDGDIFSHSKEIRVKYKAVLGAKGHHLHLYLDDQPEVMLHKLKGNYTVGKLAPGKHGICIRLMDKEHADTGIQDCAMFRVQ